MRLTDSEKEQLKVLIDSGKHLSKAEIARRLGIGKTSGRHRRPGTKQDCHELPIMPETDDAHGAALGLRGPPQGRLDPSP